VLILTFTLHRPDRSIIEWVRCYVHPERREPIEELDQRSGLWSTPWRATTRHPDRRSSGDAVQHRPLLRPQRTLALAWDPPINEASKTVFVWYATADWSTSGSLDNRKLVDA